MKKRRVCDSMHYTINSISSKLTVEPSNSLKRKRAIDSDDSDDSSDDEDQSDVIMNSIIFSGLKGIKP